MYVVIFVVDEDVDSDDCDHDNDDDDDNNINNIPLLYSAQYINTTMCLSALQIYYYPGHRIQAYPHHNVCTFIHSLGTYGVVYK